MQYVHVQPRLHRTILEQQSNFKQIDEKDHIRLCTLNINVSIHCNNFVVISHTIYGQNWQFDIHFHEFVVAVAGECALIPVLA